MVAAGEGLVQLQIADDVSQGGGGEVLDGAHGMLHAVSIQLGVGDLEVEHSVDLHSDVILGDDGLGREVHHLLLQGHGFSHPLDEGDLQVQAHPPDGTEGAQPLNDHSLGLLHHLDVRGKYAQDDDDDEQDDDGSHDAADVDGPGQC